MNRLLTIYDGDTEFSQSRLIEDKEVSQDLKTIKVRTHFTMLKAYMSFSQYKYIYTHDYNDDLIL